MNMTNYTFIDVDGEKAAMYVSYGQSTQDRQRKYWPDKRNLKNNLFYNDIKASSHSHDLM